MASSPPVCDFGWPAVDATLPGVDGKTHSIFEQAGPNGLVVAFICNHCPYVKAVIARIVRDASDLKARRHRLRRRSVPTMPTAYPEDSFDNMKLFAAAHAFPFPTSTTRTRRSPQPMAPPARRISSASTAS